MLAEWFRLGDLVPVVKGQRGPLVPGGMRGGGPRLGMGLVAGWLLADETPPSGQEVLSSPVATRWQAGGKQAEERQQITTTVYPHDDPLVWKHSRLVALKPPPQAGGPGGDAPRGGCSTRGRSGFSTTGRLPGALRTKRAKRSGENGLMCAFEVPPSNCKQNQHKRTIAIWMIGSDLMQYYHLRSKCFPSHISRIRRGGKNRIQCAGGFTLIIHDVGLLSDSPPTFPKPIRLFRQVLQCPGQSEWTTSDVGSWGLGGYGNVRNETLRVR